VLFVTIILRPTVEGEPGDLQPFYPQRDTETARRDLAVEVPALSVKLLAANVPSSASCFCLCEHPTRYSMGISFGQGRVPRGKPARCRSPARHSDLISCSRVIAIVPKPRPVRLPSERSQDHHRIIWLRRFEAQLLLNLIVKYSWYSPSA
jgi:hypothetical protein